MIAIYDKNNVLIREIEPNDSSSRNMEIMGANEITLQFSLTEYVDFPLMSWFVYRDEKYYLYAPFMWVENSRQNWDYTLIMGSSQYMLGKIKVRSLTDIPKRLKFSLHAKPDLFLKLIVDSMNASDSGWTYSTEMVAAEAKTIDFNCENCSEALKKIADTFETEWEVVAKEIRLRRVEKSKEWPIELAYGKGKGFLPGVGRDNYDSSTAISRLYVQGGDRNIDRTKYAGRDVLCLPANTTITHDGRTYKTDSEGLYLERIDQINDDISEGTLDLSNIYPMREGTVSSVITVDDEKCLYDIIDNSIPNDLDYNDYLIPEEKPTVVFQTGLLAGMEFEIDRYIHAERRFLLVPVNNLPKAPLVPQAGDKYAVFNVMLPTTYVTDAENKMLAEAAAYMHENEDPRYTFRGTLDSIYARNHWDALVGNIYPGYFVYFTNELALSEPMLIRITGIKEPLFRPYKSQITLSNVAQSNAFASKMADIKKQEVTEDRKDKDVLNFTKRRFRDAQETIKMLEKAMLEGFTESISPLTIQTMSLLVGSENLQFRFVNSPTDPTPKPHNVSFDQSTKTLTCPAGTIQHMTLGTTTISPSHAGNDYYFWNLPVMNRTGMDAEKGYYLYAKVSRSKTNQTGEFVLLENAVNMYADDNYYYLLMGILSSEFEDNRSFVSMYGFSEILPGRIVTDKIVSADGKTYFALDESKIGGNINFEDGLVSGDIGIGNNTGINAGMNGEGNANTDVRLWAGAPKENKTTAPFRVLHDGKLFATDADISGKISSGNGKNLLDSDGSGQLADGNVAWDAGGNVVMTGKLESNTSGQRVIIDPSSSNKISLVNSNNQIVGRFVFFELDSFEATRVILDRYDSNGMIYYETVVKPDGITISGPQDATAYIAMSLTQNKCNVRFIGLPTSSFNLQPGQLYINGNQLMIAT
ncbi:hypothetical protein AGMMS49525_14960 [Bacteroidia bacterium]|nr:hypothetical protein AGMMS49525_14960 [Bacteroidia bacterium]